MMRRGFTIVELVITITIMGILLTLAVVNLNSTQANARDAERKGDVESLALNIEGYYTNVDPDLFMSGGTYLGSSYMNDSEIKEYLPDLDMKNAHAPGVAESAPISVVPATNNNTTTTGVLPQPSQTNDVYVYQPLTADGALCVDPFINVSCRRFNIYYYQESDNTVQMITSKHQS